MESNFDKYFLHALPGFFPTLGRSSAVKSIVPMQRYTKKSPQTKAKRKIKNRMSKLSRRKNR